MRYIAYILKRPFILFLKKLRGDDVLSNQAKYQRKLREKGAIIGSNVKIYSDINGPEIYLISIENNVTLATGVKIITHDNSISKHFPEFTDLFGKVSIKENVFIGAYSIILPGVTIGKNSIVAAGSVVTKSIPSEEIWGGVPAKKIGNIADFKTKYRDWGIDTRGMQYSEKKSLLINNTRLIIK